MTTGAQEELQQRLTSDIDNAVGKFASRLRENGADRTTASIIVMGAIDEVYYKAKRNKYTNWRIDK